MPDESSETLMQRQYCRFQNFGKSLSKDRVLLTHDLDFGELVARSGGKLPSVIIFRLRNMTPENVNKYLHSIIPYSYSINPTTTPVSHREKCEPVPDFRFHMGPRSRQSRWRCRQGGNRRGTRGRFIGCS